MILAQLLAEVEFAKTLTHLCGFFAFQIDPTQVLESLNIATLDSCSSKLGPNRLSKKLQGPM